MHVVPIPVEDNEISIRMEAGPREVGSRDKSQTIVQDYVFGMIEPEPSGAPAHENACRPKLGRDLLRLHAHPQRVRLEHDADKHSLRRGTLESADDRVIRQDVYG